MSTTSDTTTTRQVGDVFRTVPLTREHLKSCLALFFVFAIEAWEMMIIVYTSPLIASDFGLDTIAVGNLIGAMFIGMLLGSLAWGKVAERIGRKHAILLSLATYGVISLASAFAPRLRHAVQPETAVGRGGGGHDGRHVCSLSGTAAPALSRRVVGVPRGRLAGRHAIGAGRDRVAAAMGLAGDYRAELNGQFMGVGGCVLGAGIALLAGRCR